MNPEVIPLELRARRQWVRWRIAVRDGQPTKLPIQLDGSLAKSNDLTTWAGFDEARATLGPQDAGLGYVFAAGDPFTGIDLDGCRDPQTGKVADWARAIILDFGTYAEVSPSRSGVKLWVRGKWEHGDHKIAIDAEPQGGKTPAVEVYDRGRYFAVTGLRLRDMDAIQEGQAKLDVLHERFWKQTPPPTRAWDSLEAVVDRARRYVAKCPPSISGQNGHGAAFRVACVLLLGFELCEPDAYAVMAEWNATCQPPWSEKELRHKLASAAKQPGQHGFLRVVAPQNFERVRVPNYQEPPVAREPQQSTLRDAAARYIQVVRDGKDGHVETGIPDLDYAIGGGAEYGEMMIFAGRPSHGKSAIGLQMVHHWTENGIPSAFISEEMSALALGKRTILYASDTPEEHWRTRIDLLEQQVGEHFDCRAECYVMEQCGTADVAAAAIRRAKESFGVRCVIVDYAQLLSSPGRGRVEQVTNTSIAMRRVANETGVLLVTLCQLNREIENRKSFTPQMSDLRDTGQLEQDADVIVFGVWPHRIDPSNDPYGYQLFVAKNRNRPINSTAFNCRFEPSRQRFIDWRSVCIAKAESGRSEVPF